MNQLFLYNVFLKTGIILIEVLTLIYLIRHYKEYSYMNKWVIMAIGFGGFCYTSASVLSLLIEFSIFDNKESVHALILSLEALSILCLSIGFYRILVKLITVSNVDFLTKTYTKRYIDKLFVNEKQIYAKKRKVFSLIFIDIDNFKQINDKLGHEEGNRVLREIANVLKNSLRKDDKIGRYGGDEFIILLHNTLYEEAEQVLERCKKAVLNNEEFIDFQIGISGGVSTYPYDGDTMRTLSEIADKRMYQEKNHKKANWSIS